VIVRWSYAELPEVLAEAGIEKPFVIASDRWRSLDVPPHVAWWSEVPSERAQVPDEADGILAIGGGSAIDTGKYASAQSEKPVVHVPTTYSGAEWTTHYGIRSPDRIIRGSGSGARPVGIVYDVDLTLDLPKVVSAGTAMNGLAHCAEALYTKSRNVAGEEQALAGAPLIASALPRVLDNLHDRDAREQLLRGAAHGGHALGLAGLGLAHAMAQALGGTYGLPHGAMNALTLSPALEFNRLNVPDLVQRFGDAVGGDAVSVTRDLALRGGFKNLRQFDVRKQELPKVAEMAAGRAGNQNNPSPATSEEILEILLKIW
jgi:maleylacetate reductase